jgi:hypothetical protein
MVPLGEVSRAGDHAPAGCSNASAPAPAGDIAATSQPAAPVRHDCATSSVVDIVEKTRETTDACNGVTLGRTGQAQL